MRLVGLVSCLLVFVATAKAQRFVRFISTDGHEYYGDAILPEGSFDAALSTSAHVIKGDILGEYTITKETKAIKKLLGPLPAERIRSVRMVGLNYVAHIKWVSGVYGRKLIITLSSETNATIPGWPILFYKPFTALNTPSDDILVAKGYQNQTNANGSLFVSRLCQPETELVVVMKKKAYNITEAEALDYVLGYTVGNDVSHRGWQVERGGLPQPQFSMGKDADTWAPWGPAIVSTNLIKDPQSLNLWTKVNGVTMQNDTTANMIFGVAHLVSFFSMGITLQVGDIIFTGTPKGVNLGKENPVWLTDGDVVEVGLENVGTCTNTIRHLNN
ncbi:Fumarylacetoacetate hydrolase domain-containing protein 2 [Mycena indigotica]|uniref:Fumarylacetoacetate hydrolase domain-containing protein 2 n=1 Tax=Mycena indigotica TaxID=2126181 RepID=A0A8H6W2M7_9AGAR|nr:Fumarylacetoacetate hydrolase domain-containing protein 2 [Mycena indigotica]KAF7297114.1 Fumarylacetoacetate hydrolase domain-containing protein 2 [Mycena indigotica]